MELRPGVWAGTGTRYAWRSGIRQSARGETASASPFLLARRGVHCGMAGIGEHVLAQERGKREWYSHYDIELARVERSYLDPPAA